MTWTLVCGARLHRSALEYASGASVRAWAELNDYHVSLCRIVVRLREAELLPSGKAIPEAGDRRARLKASRRRMVNLALDENLVAMPQEDETPACSVEHALHQRVSSVLQAI